MNSENYNLEKIRNHADHFYLRGFKERGFYFAHEPIYGVNSEFSEEGRLHRLARIYHLLRKLNCLSFKNFISIGAGEGYFTALVKEIFKVESYNTEISPEANYRAWELYGLTGICLEASALPFEDNSFDLVFSGEVIEHLQFPFPAILELKRISRKYVVITSEQTVAGEMDRDTALKRRNFYVERNIFTPEDFITMLGSHNLHISNQLASTIWKEGQTYSREEIKKYILQMNQISSEFSGSFGALLVKSYNGKPGDISPRYEDEELLEKLLDFVIEPQTVRPAPMKRTPDNVRQVIRCPLCHGKLCLEGKSFSCFNCGIDFEEKNGIPFLFPPKGWIGPAHDLRKYLTVNGLDENQVKFIYDVEKKFDIKNILGINEWDFSDPSVLEMTFQPPGDEFRLIPYNRWIPWGKKVLSGTTKSEFFVFVSPWAEHECKNFSGWYITMSFKGESPSCGKLFWCFDDDPYFKKEYSKSFDLVADDHFHTYHVDPSDTLNWSGDKIVRRYAFIPSDSNGKVKIKSIIPRWNTVQKLSKKGKVKRCITGFQPVEIHWQDTHDTTLIKNIEY